MRAYLEKIVIVKDETALDTLSSQCEGNGYNIYMCVCIVYICIVCICVVYICIVYMYLVYMYFIEYSCTFMLKISVLFCEIISIFNILT